MPGFAKCSLDASVLAAARRGERAAQAQIYAEYSGAVYTLARRMVRHPHVAEEILQETFVEVLRKLHRYRGDGPFGAWLRRIAVNKCLMHLRSAWQRYARPLEAATEPVFETTAAQAGRQHDLERALERLGATARAVVWLHDVEGYTHAEIGTMMGRSRSFSKSQLARAHRRLRELLDETTTETPCMQLLNNC